MANRYERLWKPPSEKVVDEEVFDMPWRENLDEPSWGQPEYHSSGQLLEIKHGMREMLMILQYMDAEQKAITIDGWINGRKDHRFCNAMDEFLETRDAYRLMSFWQERTSPFFFLAEQGFFSSKEQYQKFIQRVYSELGLEYREFDEFVDHYEEPLRRDLITFVK